MRGWFCHFKETKGDIGSLVASSIFATPTQLAAPFPGEMSLLTSFQFSGFAVLPFSIGDEGGFHPSWSQLRVKRSLG